MIATTTIADGIAIIVFATILFLLGSGGLWLLKFLCRGIRGKPQPVDPQSICVSFEAADEWDEKGNLLEMQRFADYLTSRLQGQRLGEFDGGEFGGKRVGLHFYGPDAKRMWEVLEGEVRTHAPERPLEVVFDFGKKRGGDREGREFNGNEFFVIQPGINLEANLVKYVKIFGGVNYRFTSKIVNSRNGNATVNDTITAKQVSGITATIGLKFGLFDYNLHKRDSLSRRHKKQYRRK